jgi:hypothetical protein
MLARELFDARFVASGGRVDQGGQGPAADQAHGQAVPCRWIPKDRRIFAKLEQANRVPPVSLKRPTHRSIPEDDSPELEDPG